MKIGSLRARWDAGEGEKRWEFGEGQQIPSPWSSSLLHLQMFHIWCYCKERGKDVLERKAGSFDHAFIVCCTGIEQGSPDPCDDEELVQHIPKDCMGSMD